MTRVQLLSRGLSTGDIAAQVAVGRWQRPIPGIYVTFTGPLPSLTRFWVALLHAGPDAMLSHETAGLLWRLLPHREIRTVHVTVLRRRGTRSRRGLVVHHSAHPPEPSGSPPRTPVAVTAIDLCAAAARLSEVAAILGRLAQRYGEDLPATRALAEARRNLPRRADILAVIDDVAAAPTPSSSGVI